MLGQMLSDQFGFALRNVDVLVLFVPIGQASNTEWLWVMRENVALALEEMGWVPKTSPLYYPAKVLGTPAENS
jgi:hypothetical protein